VSAHQGAGFFAGLCEERGMVSGEQFFLLTVVRRLFMGICPLQLI
jgi:hypothetical protein